MTSTSLTGGSRLWSWNYARATTTSVPICSAKSQKLAPSPTYNCGLEDQTAEHNTAEMPASARQQEQTCGQRQSSYTSNCTAARRSWRRQPRLSCRPDSQCSFDREEEDIVSPSHLRSRVICSRQHLSWDNSVLNKSSGGKKIPYPPSVTTVLVLETSGGH